MLIAFQTNRSDAHRVVLKDVQPNHTGKYRCEVSGDSPSFNTVMVSGYMHVASEYLAKRILHLSKDNTTCTAKTERGSSTRSWANIFLPMNSDMSKYVTKRAEVNSVPRTHIDMIFMNEIEYCDFMESSSAK